MFYRKLVPHQLPRHYPNGWREEEGCCHDAADGFEVFFIGSHAFTSGAISIIWQALKRFLAPISRWAIDRPSNACRRLPLTDIEREGSSPPILVTSVTSAILADVITAVARTHTERHPAGVKTEVLYLILMLSIILISLSCFCVYELADVNKVARLIFGVVDEPNAATEGGFYKPTRL